MSTPRPETIEELIESAVSGNVTSEDIFKYLNVSLISSDSTVKATVDVLLEIVHKAYRLGRESGISEAIEMLKDLELKDQEDDVE